MKKFSQILRILIGIIFIITGIFIVLLMSFFFKGFPSIIPIVEGLFLLVCAVLLLKNKWRLYPFIVAFFVFEYIVTTIYRYFYVSSQQVTIVELQNIPFYFIPALIIGIIWYIEKHLPIQTPITVVNIPNQEYAGFWIRLGAYAIDGSILLVPIVLLFIGMGFYNSNSSGIPFEKSISMTEDSLIFNIIATIFAFSYFIYFTKKNGATPGKKSQHLRVVSADGKSLTWKQVILRETIGRIASGVLNIGYIMVAFSSRKQGLHDRIAGTYVISVHALPIQQSTPSTSPPAPPTPPIVTNPPTV